jgi:hypothetical protein
VKDLQNEKRGSLIAGSSPDEIAMINAAKYYGIKFVERNE